MYQVIVSTTTGKTFSATYDKRDEADGWEHLMTTTYEGEGFKDVDVALLATRQGTVYIPTANILAVEIIDQG